MMVMGGREGEEEVYICFSGLGHSLIIDFANLRLPGHFPLRPKRASKSKSKVIIHEVNATLCSRNSPRYDMCTI